jgi:ferrous iron transport protein B
MTLFELQAGEEGWILKVKGRGAFRKRITEMGFVVGKEVKVVRKAPFGDPIVYSLMGYEVSLRSNEAKMVEISTLPAEVRVTQTEVNTEEKPGRYRGRFREMYEDPEKLIHVAFIGNPNSGKTTLFNFASHSRERVGNYSGVTIAAKEAKYRLDNYIFSITDLPGTYSLTAYSPEEMYVREHIMDAMPDVVVNVVDTSNLERNLYLTTQLIDMDIRTVVALNMYDELEKAGNSLDYKMLGDMSGIPFVPTIGSKGKGIVELFRKIIEVYEEREPSLRHIHIPYGTEVEGWIGRLQELINRHDNSGITSRIAPRFIALKLLEKDPQITERVAALPNSEEILTMASEGIRQTEKLYGEDSETLITDARYGFIEGALRVTYRAARVPRVRPSHAIDNILAHRVWGIPIFVGIMWLTFFLTFRIGEYPMAWIENGINLLSDWLQSMIPPRNAQGSFYRWPHRRYGRCAHLPPQHHHSVSGHIADGGYRIHGTGRFYHGQGDAPHRTARKIVYSTGDGLWVQCSCNPLHTYHRKPPRQAAYHPHQPLYVVQCTFAGVCAAHQRLL